RGAFREFQANDPLRMAAATSFFASFALPPILIILIQIFGVFGSPHAISRDLFPAWIYLQTGFSAGDDRLVHPAF
ncbi:MAG: hypothetical protein P4L51_24930, partial [Puia sp.]|nr:hypothetical protein [Puia sp.]